MFLQLGTVMGTVVGTVRALYGHCAGTVSKRRSSAHSKSRISDKRMLLHVFVIVEVYAYIPIPAVEGTVGGIKSCTTGKQRHI